MVYRIVKLVHPHVIFSMTFVFGKNVFEYKVQKKRLFFWSTIDYVHTIGQGQKVIFNDKNKIKEKDEVVYVKEI